jgi:hypothetical protein
MLLKIRKTVSPGLLPPPLETPSAPLKKMTQMASAMLESGAAMMYDLIKCLPTIDIGLPLAEAAPAQASEPVMDVATFINLFERDFIIRVSPMIKDSSLDRVTIVIGEDHVDPEVQQLIDKVMKHLRPERGDLLLMEGIAEAGMRRIQRYGIEAKSLLSMEENSAAYNKMIEADRLKFEHLVDTVKFVYQHLPTKPKINKLKGKNEYSAFINQYRHAVPLQFRDELNFRIEKINQYIASYDQVTMETSSLREKGMLQFIACTLQNRINRDDSPKSICPGAGAEPAFLAQRRTLNLKFSDRDLTRRHFTMSRPSALTNRSNVIWIASRKISCSN